MLHGIGEGKCKELLENYQQVTLAFLALEPVFQECITDITRRMGAGMAEFIPKEVVTIAEYDLYCYHGHGAHSSIYAHRSACRGEDQRGPVLCLRSCGTPSLDGNRGHTSSSGTRSTAAACASINAASPQRIIVTADAALTSHVLGHTVL
jgi:hypothetical protein